MNEEFKRLKESAEFSKRRQTLAKIKELDKGQGVPMDTFILGVLEQLGVLDRDADIEPWIKVPILLIIPVYMYWMNYPNACCSVFTEI